MLKEILYHAIWQFMETNKVSLTQAPKASNEPEHDWKNRHSNPEAKFTGQEVELDYCQKTQNYLICLK